MPAMPETPTSVGPARRAGRFGSVMLAAVAVLWLAACAKSRNPDAEFVQLMNTGKNYLDQGQATNAIPVFRRAVALQPGQADAHLNLANAYLLANQPTNALAQAEATLNFDRNSAAAYYVAGCADMRLRQFEAAVKMLQPAHDLDPAVAAISYQLGRAQQELGHNDDAIAAFQETVKLDPDHPVAWYALSQLLIRAGRQAEGLAAIARHNAIRAKSNGALITPDALEQCPLTRARAPQPVLRPDPNGVPVRFADATATAFGADAAKYHGPLGVLDFNHDGHNGLFVMEGAAGFRALANQGGKFAPLGELLPARPDGNYRRCLVGDLNNDRFDDALVLGEGASHVFCFATNGAVKDVTAASGAKALVGTDGALVDLDFTGKLDLMATLPGGAGLRVLQNLGKNTIYFKDNTATSGVPASLAGVRQLALGDWNNDDLMDVFVSREGQPPLYLQKQRGGPLVPTALPPGQLEGAVLAIGDVNGDSRVDLIVGAPDHLDFLFGGINRFQRLPINMPGLSRILLVDYDNDGWLDVLLVGDGLQMWRNLGAGRFANVTAKLGLDKLVTGRVEDVVAADFDDDGDTDFVVSVAGQGLKLLRNDGGNTNYQLKLRLFGNRSNASGLGVRVEVAAGPFHVFRTVQTLPIEIGVGQHDRLDSLTARWFDLAYHEIDLKVDPRVTKLILEPVLPVGSCPYLYAWDGQRFRFVTDILGSSPVGLPVSETRYAEADPREHVWLGDEAMFPPRAGNYTVQITEELREALYLDETKLVVVDHPPGTEVHTTDKFRPGQPFPRGEIWTVEHRRPLLKATRLDGTDVTAALAETDGQLVSPRRLRIPQLRGLAEPNGVILDFGPLPVDRPLVLVLTGWLRFGGGWANVAASQNPDLPFPFPRLEVETAAGAWQPVDVVVGAPSGKTKTILVDLAGKLPPGSRRLRLSSAFELHWDRIALFERRLAGDTTITRLSPSRTDLHWHGFSRFADLPWTQPLTPIHDDVSPNPAWDITPVGWCTRYGPVDELVAAEDNAVVILNGGDELTVDFAADRLPPKPAGAARDFFLYNVGWDKDSDFHVQLGWQVGPVPWMGMDDQCYGRVPRPAFPSDALMRRYTTRWVAQPILQRAAR
jgi:tetratricopeptide (TPR) repeat protein